jgi:hypothetical protein
MPTLPSKQELKSMTYRDLQRICKVCLLLLSMHQTHVCLKDWGVRANLKTDEMIDLLLETQCAHPVPYFQ